MPDIRCYDIRQRMFELSFKHGHFLPCTNQVPSGGYIEIPQLVAGHHDNGFATKRRQPQSPATYPPFFVARISPTKPVRTPVFRYHRFHGTAQQEYIYEDSPGLPLPTGYNPTTLIRF